MSRRKGVPLTPERALFRFNLVRKNKRGGLVHLFCHTPNPRKTVLNDTASEVFTIAQKRNAYDDFLATDARLPHSRNLKRYGMLKWTRILGPVD